MNKKRGWRLVECGVIILCILILMPVIISKYSHFLSSTIVTEQYNIKKGQGILESYGYDMKGDCKGVSLNIRLELTEGEVSFILRDPDGNVAWNDTISNSTKFNEIKSFDKKVGYWTLEFENVNESAEGKLSFEFKKK